MHCVFMETAFTILFIARFCDGNTNLFRKHFYHGQYLGWHHARETCKKWYTELSSVLNQEDLDRVIHAHPSGTTTPVWIGLSRLAGNWSWSAGGDFEFEKLAIGRPVFDHHLECVYMKQGELHSEKCDRMLPFSCFKTYKMIVVQEMMSWEDALAYCRSKHIDLSSLLSNYTVEKVINSTGVTTEFVWTGLRFLLGAWFWVDGETAGGDISWSKASQSQCPDMPLRCGALSVAETAFEARACEEKLNFICYSKL